VALLMARGLTNEEIATELVIALKTVETHASNALHKLGFRNRSQLAAWVAAESPMPRGAPPEPR
jgi:DNA-binding NarL/FixJ family response regulator